MKSLPPLFVDFGDTHCGSSAGLCSPTFNLSPDHVVSASPTNLWLYSRWVDFWNNQVLPEVLDKNGKKIRQLYVVHHGDFVEGLHHDHSELLSPKGKVQVGIGYKLFKPIRDMADWFGMVMGTTAHDGAEHVWSESLADMLNPDEYSQRVRIWVGDDLVDVAHHTRGKQEWTSGAPGLVVKILVESSTYGEDVPRYVIRGHTHTVDDSGEQNPRCRAITAPAWQATTSLGYKINPQRLTDIGGVIINGNKEKLKIVRYFPKRTKTSRPNDGIKPANRID